MDTRNSLLDVAPPSRGFNPATAIVILIGVAAASSICFFGLAHVMMPIPASGAALQPAAFADEVLTQPAVEGEAVTETPRAASAAPEPNADGTATAGDRGTRPAQASPPRRPHRPAHGQSRPSSTGEPETPVRQAELGGLGASSDDPIAGAGLGNLET